MNCFTHQSSFTLNGSRIKGVETREKLIKSPLKMNSLEMNPLKITMNQADGKNLKILGNDDEVNIFEEWKYKNENIYQPSIL